MSDRLAEVRARTLATESGFPFVELTRRALDPEAVRALPFETLERHVALPYELARGGTLRDEDLFLEGELAEDAPAVRAVNDILRRAIVERASDVHLIPEQGFVHVRLRVDGVVRETGMLAPEDAAGVVQRIK